MTDNIWIDILICVLCSALGGVIVATLFEFSPYAPNRVRRAVLITFWLIIVGVAPLVVVGYVWGEMAVMIGVGAEAVLAFIFGIVIASAQEAEKKEGNGLASPP